MSYRHLYAPDARCVVRQGSTVHAVEITSDGHPQLMCHVGVAAWHPVGVLRSTTSPVTCRRCLRLIRQGEDPGRTPGAEQPALW